MPTPKATPAVPPCLGMIADLVRFLCYPLSNIDSRLLPGWGDIPRRTRTVSNWSLSIALCLILIACTAQPAAAPTATPMAESPTPTHTAQPAAAPTATPMAESTTPTHTAQPAAAPTATPMAESTTPTHTAQPAAAPTATPTAESPTPTPTVQPSATPDRTFTSLTATPAPAPTATPTAESPTLTPTVQPSATPTPTSRVVIITTHLQKEIDSTAQDSSCYVDRTLKESISFLFTNSIIYLQAYLKMPDLNESDVRAIVDYLEHQRGLHERLCVQERGVTPPGKDLSSILDFYDVEFRWLHSEDQSCKAAETAEKLSSVFQYENINYLRGLFDAPTLSQGDLFQVVTHMEGESGRFAALCARED